MTRGKLTTQIEQILASNLQARNSDKELLLAYWQSQGLYLSHDQIEIFKNLRSPESVRRIRQKLQEEGKYPATDNVKQERNWNAMRVEQNAPTAKPETIERLFDTDIYREIKG